MHLAGLVTDEMTDGMDQVYKACQVTPRLRRRLTADWLSVVEERDDKID